LGSAHLSVKPKLCRKLEEDLCVGCHDHALDGFFLKILQGRKWHFSKNAKGDRVSLTRERRLEGDVVILQDPDTESTERVVGRHTFPVRQGNLDPLVRVVDRFDSRVEHDLSGFEESICFCLD